MKISFEYNPLLRKSNFVIINVKGLMNTVADAEQILSL